MSTHSKNVTEACGLVWYARFVPYTKVLNILNSHLGGSHHRLLTSTNTLGLTLNYCLLKNPSKSQDALPYKGINGKYVILFGGALEYANSSECSGLCRLQQVDKRLGPWIHKPRCVEL